MRHTNLFAAAALLALAGCSQSGSKGENNAATAAKQGAATPAAAAAGNGGIAVKLQPGEWETVVEMLKVEAPGMPPEARAMMAKTMGGGKVTVRHCVTAEEASRPTGDVFSGKKTEGNCSYKNYSVAGGHIQGEMSCKGGQGGGAMTMKMDGQFDPQRYSVTQKMTTDAGGSTMTIDSRVSGRRVGECKAGKDG